MGFLRKLLGKKEFRSSQPGTTLSNSQIGENGEWYLDDVLLNFETVHNGERVAIPWTLGMSFEGLQVFGGTGSGKSSGTAKTVACSMLKAGFGGLVLCAKTDEAETWCEMAEEYGREDDVILFSPEARQGFNFLDYEMNRKGRGSGNSENVIAVLMEIIKVSGNGDSKNDEWAKAMRALLRNCLDLLRLAKGKVQLSMIYEIVLREEKQKELIELALAGENSMSESEKLDLKAIGNYFMIEWAEMGDRTKSSIVMNLTGLCDPFLRGIMRDSFCMNTTVTPEEAEKGKIIIVDMSIKDFNELGQYAGVIWKYLFQRFSERRGANDRSRPLFIFADESQFFITNTDADFQTTARSSRCATVYLTQNLPNYHSATGGTQKSKADIDSLMGNMQTKIFHQNGDKETNTWASETIGREKGTKFSVSSNVNFDGGGTSGSSEQEANELLIQPSDFLKLAKGGTPYNFVVTGVLFQSGRMFGDSHFIHIAFNQKARV